MDNLVNFKIDIGINAQRMVAQIQSNNKNVEKIVENGIRRALDEILTNENLEVMVAEETKKAFTEMIKSTVSSWQIKEQLRQSLQKTLESKIQKISDEWADKALKNLE